MRQRLYSSTEVALASGTLVGPYEITTAIGAGGMGEVYRARDAKLNRHVALKVLPESFAIDTDRLARFKREAQVLAALNHPNIAAIYGFEDAGAVKALVLELVEGTTLADRLRPGKMPLDEVLPIARQIAEALEAAHDVGIVHRDLKPANIKRRPDGTVKVLDFGLAKPVVSGDRPDTETASPTITSPAMTERGVILGTAAYMSPEQAKGRPVDGRTDIWSFGVVLFEMLSGRRPFRGEGVSDTLAAVLRADPTWTDLPPETPPPLQRLVRRCLQKDVRRRWQHMGDLRVELTEMEQGVPGSPPLAVATNRRMSIAAVLAGAALVGATGAGVGRWSMPRQRAPAASPIAFGMPLAPGERLADSQRSFGISPDGSYIAYAAVRDGRQQLYLRALDRSEAVAIAGTDRATYPVFSPDGSSLAFWADGWVKHVPVAGGAFTTVAPAQAARALAWAPGDRIVFAASASSGLSVVSASGGTPEPLTELDAGKGETNHRWPVVLPDGSGVLFAVQRRSRTELDIEGVSFRSKARTPVRAGGFPIQIMETGHLVYAAVNGDVFAAPFEPSRMELSGAAVPLPERPGYTGVPGMTAPAVAPGGTMVSVALQEPSRALVLIGRDGTTRTLDAPARNYLSVRIAPDGRRFAVVTHAGIAEWDVWIMDAAGDAPPRRLTVSRFSIWPSWESADTLMYSAFENEWKLLSRNVDLNEPARTLVSAGLPQEPIVLARLPDRSLAYTLNIPQQTIFVARDSEPPRAIPPPETGQFDRLVHGLSPDGRWLAYTSNQSGRSEVYVTAFPEGGVTRQVSGDGGDHAVWAKKGLQLFYHHARRDEPNQVVAVTVNPDGTTGPRTVATTGDYLFQRATFDAFPDGSLLLIRELPADPPNLQVVVNWTASRGLTSAR